jgi:hypothetical protein
MRTCKQNADSSTTRTRPQVITTRMGKIVFRQAEVGRVMRTTLSASCQSCRDSVNAHSPMKCPAYFPQWNFDDQTAHNIIQLKVFLRAVRLGIVTGQRRIG